MCIRDSQIVKSDIYHILFDIRKESNPCSLCAKMRKGALNQAVKEMGCNKVAYAHHKDDIVETMLLSMIFEGRFYSFSPKTWLDRMDLTVIRPLMFVDEMDVIGFKNKYNLPVVKSKCPVDGYTKRQYAKELLRQINKDHPGAKERMLDVYKRQVVEGPKIEKMLGYTNLDSEKGFAFFQKFLKETGILDELEAKGIQEGDTVRMYGLQFDYYK